MELCDIISFTLTAAGAAHLTECDMDYREYHHVYNALPEAELQRLYPANYYEGQVLTMSFSSLFCRFERYSFHLGSEVPFVDLKLVESN